MNHRYELPTFLLYDYQAIQEHLTKMAQKGWRLDKIGTGLGFWRYRRAEPAPIRYEVTYTPQASAYDSFPTVQEEALEDICAGAGWVKVASMAQLQVYCNEDLRATPLETDELSRVQTIRKSMKRHYFLPQGGVLLLFCLQLWMQLVNLRRYPAGFLSTNWMLGIFPLLTIAVLCHGATLVEALIWGRRAERAAREGDPAPRMGFYRWGQWVLLTVLVLYLGVLLLDSQVAMLGWMLLAVPLLLLFVNFIFQCSKALGAPKWANIVAPGVGCMLLMMLLLPLIFFDTGVEEPPEGEIPMTISDLRSGFPGETRRQVYSENASVVLIQGSYADQGGNIPGMHYEILDSPFDFALNLCQEYLYNKLATFHRIDPENSTPQDRAEEWGAAEAWYIAGEEQDYWLIRWDTRLVDLETGWHLTPEEIQRAAEILKP